ncbi:MULTISPECIES: hypothetical protein [Prochlorococcus]|uniref:hypothetical protein n=1 Tax=Prochlorococcus TaxID=1218 RepID=UPI00187BEF02|nr:MULTISPECIES: hypothetical protein [Prochlorococcus]
MELLGNSIHKNGLEMATEDFYRNQAKCYKSSEAYLRMRGLYPVLQSSINDCEDEKLID